MKSSLSLLLVVLLIGESVGSRISERLNEQLQEKCGRKSHYRRKTINGNPARPGDHPWAASVYARYLDQHTQTFHPLLGPGTLISPKHVIAFNSIRGRNGKLMILGHEAVLSAGTCEGRHLILPREMNSRYDVDFEMFSNFTGKREFKDTIERIIIINGCDDGYKVDQANPMIIELKESLHMNRNRMPACLSNSPDNFKHPEEFPVFGVVGGFLHSVQMEPITCSREVRVPFTCASAVDNNRQGLCSGDFGGSAVADIDGQYTILGVYTKGNMVCSKDPKKIEDYQFLNIGYFREEICETTGVCVDAPESEGNSAEVRTEPITTTTTVFEVTATDSEDISTPPYDVYIPSTSPEPTTEDTWVTSNEHTVESTTEDIYDYDATTAEPIGHEGEVIYAPLFETMELKPKANCSDGHQIKAETFEPMRLGGGAGEQRQTNIKLVFHLFQ